MKQPELVFWGRERSGQDSEGPKKLSALYEELIGEKPSTFMTGDEAILKVNKILNEINKRKKVVTDTEKNELIRRENKLNYLREQLFK